MVTLGAWNAGVNVSLMATGKVGFNGEGLSVGIRCEL